MADTETDVVISAIGAISKLITKGSFSKSEQDMIHAMIIAYESLPDPKFKAAANLYGTLVGKQLAPKPKTSYAAAAQQNTTAQQNAVQQNTTQQTAAQPTQQEPSSPKPTSLSQYTLPSRWADDEEEESPKPMAKPTIASRPLDTYSIGRYFDKIDGVPGIQDSKLTRQYSDAVNKLLDLLTSNKDRFLTNTGRINVGTILSKTAVLKNGLCEIVMERSQDPEFERLRHKFPVKDFISGKHILYPYIMATSHPNFATSFPFKQFCYSSCLIGSFVDSDRTKLLADILKIALSGNVNKSVIKEYNMPEDLRSDEIVEYVNYHMIIELLRAVQSFETTRILMVRCCEFIVCFGNLLGEQFLGQYGYDTKKIMKYASTFLAMEGIKRS